MFKLYSGEEIHAFMFPDYRVADRRWIDAKALAAMDCTRDEPNCGACLPCHARNALDSTPQNSSEPK